jgi:hypothetical protein
MCFVRIMCPQHTEGKRPKRNPRLLAEQERTCAQGPFQSDGEPHTGSPTSMVVIWASGRKGISVLIMSSAPIRRDSRSSSRVFSCALTPGMSTSHPTHQSPVRFITALSFIESPHKRDREVSANLPCQLVYYLIVSRNLGLEIPLYIDTMPPPFS